MKRSFKNERYYQPAKIRTAFTLIEMLVTVAVTLIVMLALVQAFQWIGERVAISRAAIEMSGTIRGVANRLQQDLDSLTVPVRPWPDASSGLGYFEYVEGTNNDYSNVANTTIEYNSILGDTDDILAMTVYSSGTPFTGRFANSTKPGQIESSQYAEVIWWVQWDDVNGDSVVDHGERVLRRRVLLIRPDLNGVNSLTNKSYMNGLSPNRFFNENDISARLYTDTAGNQSMVANSLADLTVRQNRFARFDPTPYSAPSSPQVVTTIKSPYELITLVKDANNKNTALINQYSLKTTSGSVPKSTDVPSGEDIMLSNIKAFDVRAFDTTAIIANNSGRATIPGDPGNTAGTNIGRGAFVDLQYNNSVTSDFTGSNSATPSYLARPAYVSATDKFTTATYDTWSWTYEIGGAGLNGVDDNSDGIVDDVRERLTSPPYPVPMRGLQVRIRIYEPDTRQIRQVTVASDFTPD